jgi:hypothetical protein
MPRPEDEEPEITGIDSEVDIPGSLELIQRAEIDMQITTARKYPRDLAKVKRRMISFATLDEDTAESCFYTLKRTGSDGETKKIQGPSVRLAEIAISCYGNIRAASHVIDNDGKVITSRGMCHDLETNSLVAMEVRRRITNKYGKTFSEDMQVVTGNAANAIAFRNAVFKVVPMALIKPVYEEAMRVAVGDASTLSDKRTKIIKRLNDMKIDTPRILETLGKSSVENIDLSDLETLIGLGTALKDGDTTIDEAFPRKNAAGDAKTADEVKKEKVDNLRQQAPAGNGHPQTETKPTEAKPVEPEAKPEAKSEPSSTPVPEEPKVDEPAEKKHGPVAVPDKPKAEQASLLGDGPIKKPR